MRLAGSGDDALGVMQAWPDGFLTAVVRRA